MKKLVPMLLGVAYSIIAASVVSAELMTVQGAFQALGVPYVPFDVQHANMPGEEKRFLKQFFDLIERSVLERVQTMQALSVSEDTDLHVNEFQKIEQQIRDLQVPPKLEDVHALVINAIEEERMFIEQWRMRVREGKTVDIMGDPLMQSSSNKLHQAYQSLMQLYPSEGRNREAMEHHLCALDFI